MPARPVGLARAAEEDIRLPDEALTVSISKPEQVARLLLDRIIKEELRPGDGVGTEAELLAQLQVSRPTLRESLRILESQGVLTLRPGPRGGIIVSEPDVAFVAHTLSVFLRLKNVPFIAILKAREAIEPALVREAALNGTEADFAEMEASILRLEAVEIEAEAIFEENRRFHDIIARAAGNSVLETFWSAISILASGERLGLTVTAKSRDKVVEAHRRILAACRARDPEAAVAVMIGQLADFEDYLRVRFADSYDAPTRIAPRPGRRIG